MASTPKRWILLIAVDFYVDTDKRLEGCVNDVSDLASWLRHQETYAPIHIKTLLAENTGDSGQKTPPGPVSTWPTLENFEQSIQEITELAKPGDVVHIHYSGHGTLKPATAAKYRESRENNGVDAALVLFDREKEVGYLRGIDLAHIFDDLVKKQLKLSVVLDCCHSGGISRKELSTYVHIRGISWDAEKAALSPTIRSTNSYSVIPARRAYRDGEVEQHWLLRAEGYTLIAGCGPHEIAGECRGEDGRIHGALSYFLLNVLVSGYSEGLAVTYKSIHRQLQAKLHTRLPQQHPMLLGNSTATFLGSQPAERSTHSSYNIVKASGRDQIWLGVGHAHGVCVDDMFVIHPEDLRSSEILKRHTEMNKVKIVATYALQSQAKLIQISPGSSIRAGWFATLFSRSILKTQVVPFNSAGNEWNKAINESMWLQSVDREEANLTLSILQLRITDLGMVKILNGSGYDFTNIPSISLDEERAIHNVVAVLEHLAKFLSIENLESPSSNAMVSESFSVDLRAENEAGVNPRKGALEIEEGSKLVATFVNHTDKPLNLVVLNLRPLRQVERVYPPRTRGECKVIAPKGTQHGISHPGEISFKITMSFPDRVSPDCSVIEDTFKFFVTTRPSSFDTLELSELSDEVLNPDRRPTSTNLAAFIQDLAAGYQHEYILRRGSNASEEYWSCCNFVVSTKRTKIMGK